MLVGILSLERKNEIYQQYLQPAWKFNPIMNQNFNWTITKNEIDNAIGYEWMSDLVLEEFIPITQYEFLQFNIEQDCKTQMDSISNCLGEQIQPKPYLMMSNTTRQIMGYAIIATQDVKLCLTESQLNTILTASINDITIFIQ
jgi:hypothetical protein